MPEGPRPDDRYLLSEDQRKKAQEHLIKHWGEHAPCTGCGKSNWSMGNALLRAGVLAPGQPGGHIIGGPFYAFLPIFCMNCGHTLLVNAKSMDLIPDPDKQSNAGKDT